MDSPENSGGSRSVKQDETCWTLIRDAAHGDTEARNRFAQSYLDVVRASLRARWRRSGTTLSVQDAVQDVFLECFRPDGALTRVRGPEGGGFRTYLLAVTRNVARRHEERRQRRDATPAPDGDDIPSSDATLSDAFDREWALSILARARQRQARWAAADGERGKRRLELLRLRFEDGLPIRDIASRWQDDADRLHAEYRRAREEFKRALREEVHFNNPQSSQAVDRECLRLLALVQGR